MNTTSEVTFYGGPDNDPPGSAAIAYPQIHKQAGGTGTYADPITFAAPDKSLGWLQPGTIVYYPKLHKYFIMEDSCAACSSLYKKGIKRIDLWSGAHSTVQCEENRTGNGDSVPQPIIVHPYNNKPVDTTPIC